jgi:hypothetical protein
MRQAPISNNLFLKHSVVRLWITPNVENSRHFINGIQLKKHMQEVPIKFNLLSDSQELSTEQTLKTTINSCIENVQLTPTKLNHSEAIEGTNLSQSTMIEPLSITHLISINDN